MKHLTAILSLVFASSAFGATVNLKENERPFVGVLSQEQNSYFYEIFAEENYTSYIPASYVKDLQKSGARVVPILIGKDRAYYRDLMQKINGVHFPGGVASLRKANGYADAAQYIYEYAIELNDAGDYFPIIGTCLGMEYIIMLASGRGEIENRSKCNAFGNFRLIFTEDYRTSKMYKDLTEEEAYILANEEISPNAHKYCIFDENLEAYNLTEDWRPTAYTYDSDNLKFIASYENRRYPFYGLQFHPEKAAFEWQIAMDHPHSTKAVKTHRHFMDFFVSECRKSTHSFKDEEEENEYLISNYPPVNTGRHGFLQEELYFFEPRGAVTN